MNLYLLRHAIAVERGTSPFTDEERPLTPDGIGKMQKAAACFPSLIGTVDVLFSSPLVRARETAVIAAKSLRHKKKIRIIEELSPAIQHDLLISVVNNTKKEKILIVGHEPGLGELASVLTGSAPLHIEFKKGALCLITFNGKIEKGKGTIRFLLQPKQLRAMSE